jgi:hypothetical protein
LKPEELKAILSYKARVFNSLGNSLTPHAGQMKILRAIFQNNHPIVFVQCGRKFGKTATAIYTLYRWALMKSRQSVYYFSPFQTQTKEILWANGRLQNFCQDLQESVNNTEMRIFLKNESFIKASGSDNSEAIRGITPDLVVYDEFRDFKSDFHRAMGPNLAAKKAKLVIFTTPPDIEGECLEMAEYAKKSGAYFEMPTHENPHIDRNWLDMEKKRLISHNEEDVWLREYLAKFVKGGKMSIFPMFKSENVVKPHNEIMKEIEKKRHKLEWYIAADPGTASVFGVLIGALDRYNKRIYLLDEIYETETAKSSVDQIWPRIDAKRHEVYPPLVPDYENEWTCVYDEAATWFSNEVADRYGIGLIPTMKSYHKKEMGISLIRDILLHEKVVISDRCQKLVWEMENYTKDDKGRIQKLNDHLIDAFRYLLGASNYTLNEVDEPEPESVYRRAFSLEEDLGRFYGHGENGFVDSGIWESEAWS